MLRHLLHTKLAEAVKEHQNLISQVVIAAGIIPLLALCVFIFQKNSQAKKYREQIENLHILARKNEQLLSKRQELMQRINHASDTYIADEIEGMQFLESEIKDLEAVLAAPALSENVLWQDRLQFLTERNRLLFTEEERKSSELFTESQWIQQEPVEMGDDDLKQLLSRLEGIFVAYHKPGEKRPDLFLSKFSMKNERRGVWSVTLGFIKREKR